MKIFAFAFALCCFASGRVLAQEASGAVPSAPDSVPGPASVPAAPDSPAAAIRDMEAAEKRRNGVEARLRALIGGYGYESRTTQDAIIEFLRAEEVAKRPLRDTGRRLISALRRGAPPERLRELVAEYKSATEADRARRTVAQAALDARLGFSLDPRLEAFLWISGILGDGSNSLFSQPPGRRRDDGREEGRDNPREGGRDDRREGGREGAREGGREGGAFQPRRGVAIGTLLARGDVRNGEVWVEVGSERGERERYTAWWRPGRGFDMQVLSAMSQLPLGARVRLEWQGEERKHVVSLAPATAPFGPLSPPPAGRPERENNEREGGTNADPGTEVAPGDDGIEGNDAGVDTPGGDGVPPRG